MLIELRRRFECTLLWLALLANLFGAFLPTTLHLLATVSGTRTVAVCSTFGIKQVQIGADATVKQPATEYSGIDRCDYCLVSQLSFSPALLSARVFFAPVTTAEPLVPAPVFSALVHEGAPVSQPRGPPVIS